MLFPPSHILKPTEQVFFKKKANLMFFQFHVACKLMRNYVKDLKG